MSVRRLSSVLVACAVVLVVVPPPSILAAGRVAAPPPGADDLESVRVRIAELEDRALAARARGRAAEAAEPLAEAVELAIRLVSDSADPADSGPDGGGGGRDAFAVASAESLLLLFDATIRQADAFASGRERLRPWLALPDLHPLLEARLRFLEARYAHAAGDGPDGFALGTKLGFLTDWQILGPFDNEQGSGFGLALPPETGFDPTAVYEGKAREVKWRTLPPHGRGYLALEGLFDPSEHVLVYLTTVLSLERATDVAFRLGTADGVEVFVDGHSVFRHDARRGAALDQDAFGIRLEAGDHVVLVKIGERTGSFGSTVRVTAPDGAPLEGWTQDASTPRLEAATHAIDGRLGAGGNAAEGPLAVPAAVDVLHAPAALRSLVTSDGSERSPALRLPFVARGPAVNGVPFEARLARRAAAAFLLLDIDDPRERTAERLARRAVELAPQDPHALYLLASAVSPPIKMRPEIEENARREHLLAVLELEPEHAEAALDLAAHYLGAIEIPDRAIAAAERALAISDDFVRARLVLHDALRWKGLEGLADAELERLERERATGGPARTDALLALARRMERRGRPLAAGRLALEALDVDRGSVVARAAAVEWSEKAGDFDTALTLVEEDLRHRPLAVGTMVAKARFLRALGRADEGRAMLEAALERNPQSASLWKVYGRDLRADGSKDLAVRALETAAELDPKDRWVEGYLELLEDEQRPFEEAYPFDVDEVVAEAETWETDDDEPYRYLLRRSLVRLHDDGTASRYHHDVIEVRSRAGAESLARYPIPLQAESQRVRLRGATVTRTDGSVQSGELLAGRRSGARWVALPVLEPGDRIELAYRVDDVRRGLFGDYFGTAAFLQRPDGAAVLRSRYTLIAPGTRHLQIRERGGVPEPETEPGAELGTIARTWEMHRLARVDAEANMPPRDEFFPLVEITTYRDWNEFSRWWWSLIRDELQPSEAMNEFVDAIASESESNVERIRRVYEYVAGEIRYVAWEFGIHGYQPYNASTIFARRFGDCKDKAILMATMLDRMGIESHPVLIRAARLRGEQELATPLLGHFNHCILYVPELEGVGQPFLDGTAQFHEFGSLPASDRGAPVLIVEGETSRMAKVPEADPGEHVLSIDERVAVRADGSARVEGRMRAHGESAARLRALLADPSQREERVMARFSSLFGPVETISFELPDVTDLSVPLDYRYEIEIPRALRTSGRQRSFPCFFSVPSLSDFTELDERRHDLLLPSLNAWESTLTVEFDPDLRVDVPFDDVTIESPFGSFERTVEREGRCVTVRGSFRTTTRRIEAEAYPEFRRFVRRIDARARDAFRIR